MKIDTTTVLVNIATDKPLEWDGEKTPTTIGNVLIEALSAPMEKPSPLDLVKHYDLAEKVAKAKGELDLTPEQVVLLKELISKRFPLPLVAGPAYRAIEKGSGE